MRSLKVLIVEQNPARLLQLHQMLNACGVFGVRVAEDLHAARRSLHRQGAVDVLVLGSQLLPATSFFTELGGGRQASALANAVIVQGPVGYTEPGEVVRRARQAGLWVLGVLPWGQAICPLHNMLCRYRMETAEALTA
jgi:CheY-like chemotaxis protein